MGIRSLLSNILVATGDAATQSLLKNVLDGQGRLLTVSRARQALSLARSGNWTWPSLNSVCPARKVSAC